MKVLLRAYFLDEENAKGYRSAIGDSEEEALRELERVDMIFPPFERDYLRFETETW